MDSGSWRQLDLFPSRNGYKRTFPVEFCAFHAWASLEGFPELGDSLIDVLAAEWKIGRGRVLRTAIRSVGNSAKKPGNGPKGVRCRKCGHEWKPEGRAIDAKKCPVCKSWWIQLKWK